MIFLNLLNPPSILIKENIIHLDDLKTFNTSSEFKLNTFFCKLQ
jgi:hypothetical protein